MPFERREPGPFALASYFIDTQNFLIEIGMANAGLPGSDPEAIHHALDLAADALIAFGKSLIGNLDPVTVLLQGTCETMRDESLRCLETGRNGGFALGSGCVVPRTTPLENVREMVAAARSLPAAI